MPASALRSRPLMTVDVFTAVPYLGNPVAVVLDAAGLSDAQMQQFACWTNLSETTFVLPPSAEAAAQGADYRLRIFTPEGELAFAGHPTLGSCHAWLAHGGQPHSSTHVLQECQQGLVQIARRDQRLAFCAPALQRQAVEPALLAQVTAALGLEPAQVLAAQQLYNGSPWMGMLLDDPDTLLALEPDWPRLAATGQKLGLAARYPQEDTGALIGRSSREARAFAGSRVGESAPAAANVQLEVRGLVPSLAMEDPVTGSLNAALAQWLTAEGWLQAPYTANQGVCVGRAGEIAITPDATGALWVGGHTVTCVQGQVLL